MESECREEILATEKVPIDDPVRQYLNEIGRYPLLSADDEVRLAKQRDQGDEISRLATEMLAEYNPQTAEGISLLQEQIRGTEMSTLAKQRLTESNLRLVVSIARKYLGRGMAILDLIQEGNLGLMRAAEKFRYEKGYRFSTYAYWWIRQAVTRAIADQARTIRVPVHMVGIISQLSRTTAELQHDLGRIPTDKELAQAMGVTVDKITDTKRYSQVTVSLETPRGDEGENTLEDVVPDPAASIADATESKLSWQKTVDLMREILYEREFDVFMAHAGLGNQPSSPRTLASLGKQYGLSRERMRQISEKAREKLNKPSNARRLMACLTS